MTQQEFDILSQKYLDNECTAEEIVFLEEWANLQSELGAKIQFGSNDLEIENLERNLWMKIKKDTSIIQMTVWKNIKWISAGLAASVLILMGYVYFCLSPL